LINLHGLELYISYFPMKENEWLPRLDEPMEEYLKSDRYRQNSSGITFSDFEGQEEANYSFWRNLTPRQRLELHFLMIETLYPNGAEKSRDENYKEIVFNEIFL